MMWWGVAYMIGAGLLLGLFIWSVNQDGKRLNAPIAAIAIAVWPVVLVAVIVIGLLARISEGRKDG